MRLFTLLCCCLGGLFLHAQTNHAVGVTSNVFTPANLTVRVGDTVTWTNTQGNHNVNALTSVYPDNPEGFRNGDAAPPTWTYQYVFTLPGTYDYRCDPHASFGMVGQVVVEAPDTIAITEVMYDPPETGSDSLEFIEIYNPSAVPVNLEKWTLVGANFTFPDFTLAPDSVLIVAVNETAFRNVFSYDGVVFQWESGGLNNGGETVGIMDSLGTDIFSFRYDDAAPWPTTPDGDGYSLVLCDVTADPNDGANWRAAYTSTGATINDTEVFADPGTVTDCAAAPPTVSWLDGDRTADEEDGALTFRVLADNLRNGSLTVSAGAGSTLDANDYSVDPALPATFTVGDVSMDTLTVTVTLTDDMDIEADETLELTLVTDDGSVSGPATIVLTVRDNDSDAVITPIDDINDLDADGVAISDGMMVTLQGTVHCIDFRGSDGLQFWIIEAGGDGINVFNFDDVDNYVVTEGDLLQITGVIDQFRGLLEIVPTEITVISQGNDLTTPTVVDSLGEYVESQYVSLDIARIIEDNPIREAGGGLNVSVVPAGQTDTVILRAEFETGIDEAFLTDYFANGTGYRVTGLASQFDFEAPFTDSYQLLPCSREDFAYATSTREPAWAAEVLLFPNPTAGELNVRLPRAVAGYRLLDLHGRAVRTGRPGFGNLRLDLTDLPRGLYQLQLIDGKDLVTRPVLKQ